ncbi:MAG: class I SAM-dependent methyltransferase [Nitrospira sp.]|nr:class I SAM-dependent methyltransferase [Nitrospira sp.]
MNNQSATKVATPSEGIIRSRMRGSCFICGSSGETLYEGLMDFIFNAPGEWNLKKCVSPDCGLIWLDPMPLEEDIILAYNNYYTHFDAGEKKNISFKRRVSRFIDKCYLNNKYGSIEGMSGYMRHIGICRFFKPLRSAALDFRAMYLPVMPGKLIEIGCGSGDNLKFLQELGWSVEGIDFDSKAVANAIGKGLKVKTGMLEAQGYPDCYFDVIIMSHLIEHVHEPMSLLAECWRILRCGGRLVVVTPNSISLLHRLFGASWLPLDPPRHLYLFSPQALSSLAMKANFQNMRVFTTVREADNMFLASRDVRLTGRHVWGRKQPQFMKKVAKVIAVIEWTCLAFFPHVGEEIVLIGEK